MKTISVTVSQSTELANITGIYAGEQVQINYAFDVVTNTAAMTMQLVVADRPNGTILTTANATHVNDTNGTGNYVLTSTQTGNTVGVGTFDVSIQRTDSGNQTNLLQGQMPIQGA